MKRQLISHIINQVYSGVQIVTSFNTDSHIEYILFKTELQEYFLLWLPVTLDTCVIFPVKMNVARLVKEFQAVPLQNRITYILEHFISTDFHDVDHKESIYLQKNINRNGVHH